MIHDMIMAAAGASGPAAPSDADFENTVLLLHGDGTNGAQNNTFLDSSTNNFTITRNGNTTQGSFSPFSKPDGRWGNYFDGSGDSLTVTYNASMAPGSNDFTIEGWYYITETGATELPFFIIGSNTYYPIGLSFFDSSGYKVQVNASYNGSSWAFNRTGNITVSKNTWVHVALVRNSTALDVYVNGVKDTSASGAVSGSLASDTGGISIGAYRVGGTAEYNGYISNTRYVNGTAVYTSAFTPPTAPLTSITNTQVLTCQSNRFKDNSTNNFTITRNGDVTVTPFSPFPITTAYDPAVNGGSGYFDGSGDNLTLASNAALEFGTGAYTVEFWLNPGALSGTSSHVIGSNSTGGFLAYVSNAKIALNNFGIGDVLAYNTPPALNAWTHIAFVREGTGSNQAKLYVNGVAQVTGTDSNNWTVSTNFVIASNASSGQYLTGYLSNIRIVKGTAVYTSAFTPPTAPLTAIANTSLLCNFTNAGIFDNTGFNNLETVGNAQIDTTVKKYGTGSMEFDGTGDWLLMPNTPDQQLGTGNFTIEFWVYLASGDTGSNRGLVAKGTSTTGFLVSLNTTEKVVFTYATSTITSSGAITTNAWNHIAVVREGTGSNQTKIYIGGTNDGTGTVSTDFNQTSVMYVGANRTGGDPMKGFIDDLRITKGIARYTSNFTPPTAALPDIGT